MRASELSALQVSDLELHDTRLVLHLPRSKEDALGHGEAVPVHASATPELCAVRAVRLWLERLPSA